MINKIFKKLNHTHVAPTVLQTCNVRVRGQLDNDLHIQVKASVARDAVKQDWHRAGISHLKQSKHGGQLNTNCPEPGNETNPF